MNSNIGKPLSLEGNIFFAGIGGIGMSAIAEILHHLGYKVQGSDQNKNANVERLEKLGIKVFIGQKADNIRDASIIVRSSAVQYDNPELLAAKDLNIPILARAEMLAEIMKLKKCVTIAGSHGKTTTTSIMAALFENSLPGTTVINGGILNSCESNAYFGEGEWLVAEADESDGSFLLLPAQVAVVTNIDPEHLDHYGNFTKLKQAFSDFVQKVPADGAVVYCFDRPELYEVVAPVKNAKLISYGFNVGADLRAVNIRVTNQGYVFDVKLNPNLGFSDDLLANIELPIFGKHNIENALATIAVGISLKFSTDKIRSSLAGFLGVKRRLTLTGVVNDIMVIDDYGHHPAEIKATMQAITEMRNTKSSKGKIVAILQPHRYSRVQSLFPEFAASLQGADIVLIGDIFAAGENPIDGVSKESLAQEMEKIGQSDVRLVEDWDQLDAALKDDLEPGDIVVCLGAGSITKYANELPAKLARII